jgi:hypothetical protein
LKKHELPGSDQIMAELIKVEGETLWSEIHKLINCVWSKEELPNRWKESIIIPVYKNGSNTGSNNYCGTLLLSNS